MKDDVFIVIGSGQAGIQLCNSLRNYGYEGKLVLVGEEPVLPYQRPPLSKSFLLGEVEQERLFFRPQAHFEKQAIDLMLSSQAIEINPEAKQVKLEDGKILVYTKLALATGARVRRLGCEGSNSSKIHYIRTLNDSVALRIALAEARRVAIIGGGFVGLEVAAVARKMGKSVVVIESQERLMVRVVSLMLSEFYAALHRKNGVDLRLGLQVNCIKYSGELVELQLEEGYSIESDIIVAGIGALANDGLAMLAGIECDRGIVVDNRCVTSDKNIVAAGDCTVHYNQFADGIVRLESVQNAVDQAKVAASSMLDGDLVYTQVPWFWSDQYDVKLQIAGISSHYDYHLRVGDPKDNKFSILYFKNNVLIAADSINDPVHHMAVRKLLVKSKVVLRDIEANLADLISYAKQ